MHNIRSLSSAVGRNERLAVWGARSKRGFAKNDYADVAARGRGRCRCIFSFEHAHPMHYARLSPMLEDFQAQVNSLNWLSGDPVRIYIDSGSSSEAMAMDGTGCLPAGDTLRVPSIDRLASNASGEVEIVKDVGESSSRARKTSGTTASTQTGARCGAGRSIRQPRRGRSGDRCAIRDVPQQRLPRA